MAPVTQGSGTFRLIKTMGQEGYLHVSFYPKNGSGFGGVYFGQGAWVLHNKNWASSGANATSLAGQASPQSQVSAASNGPNAAMSKYLGAPVPPPPAMNAAYSRQGLADAIQLAARNAGITLTRVEIDDSEYPCIVGVVCQEADWKILLDQMQKMPGYEYNGGYETAKCHTFTLVPWSEIPANSMQGAFRRLGVRELMLCETLLDGTSQPPAASSDPNAAIFKYLGKPVPPPPTMNEAFSKKGLNDAIQLASQNAGIALTRVEIDDSEYPSIVGVVCRESDWKKVLDQMGTMPGYEYNGGFETAETHTFSLVPAREIPSNSMQRTYRRMSLRELMLCERIMQSQQ
jgi:hypothetical protein